MEKETARIEAFSDAVFAIAITLLVLDLHVPDLSLVNDDTLKAFLFTQWPSFLAFLTSFFSILIMWVNHHKIFKQIYQRNTGVMLSNGLVLLLASSVSYSTAMLARFFNTGAVHTAMALYTGLFVLINLSFNLLWHVASKDRHLLRPDITRDDVRKISRTYLVGLPIHFVAFLLSFYVPLAALLLCVSLWIYWAYTSGKVVTKKQVDD